MEGMIIKCVAGMYEVYSNGIKHTARAAGRFRNNNTVPLVGDRVILYDENGEKLITEILERKNSLIRPAIANVSTLVLTVAVKKPNPDLKMLDTMINYCRILEIEPIICINKCDYGVNEAGDLASQYIKSGIRVYLTSQDDRNSLKELKSCLKEGITCFCGQSAVGKSTIMNYYIGNERFETGTLSRKTDRGKHTTRCIELVEIENNKWLADTPGFSLLETPKMDPEDLKNLYYEFDKFRDNCRFIGCNHINEPDCAVKEAVNNGILSEERYSRYIEIFNEMNDKWRKRYD